MKLFVIIILLVMLIYNIKLSRNIIIPTKQQNFTKYILIAFLIISLIIFRKYDTTITGLIIVVLANLLCVSFVNSTGITNKGINLLMGGMSTIKHVDYSKINKIDLKVKDEIKLNINVYGSIYNQIYDLKYLEQIGEIIKEKDLA